MVAHMDDVIEKSIIELFDDFKNNPEYFKDEKLQHPDNKINKGYIIFFCLGKIINNQERKVAHIQNKYKILESKIKNDGIKIIFACIDNIDGRHTYSIMHNINNTFPKALDEEYCL